MTVVELGMRYGEAVSMRAGMLYPIKYPRIVMKMLEIDTHPPTKVYNICRQGFAQTSSRAAAGQMQGTSQG
jgi:hypothetical protein